MDVKRSAAGGVMWTSLSFAGQQVLQNLVTILLARVLLPDDYGVVSLATLTISLIGLLRSVPVGTALVQKREPTRRQLASVFWFNAAIGAVSTAVLLGAARPLGGLLAEPRVVTIFLLLSPTFFLNSLTTVHGALLARQRNYRLYALRELAAMVLSSVVAVALAYTGSGYFALVGQTVAKGLFSIVFLWRTVPWRPTLEFDWAGLRELLGFGLPLMGSNLIQFLTRNLDNLLVGRVLGAAALGLYGFAYGIVQTPIQLVQSVLGRVMFPEMSRIQDDLPLVRAVYLGSLRYIAAFLWLPLGGVLVLAPAAVPYVFGAHWGEAVALLQVFLLVAVPQTVATTVGWIYNSQGKTRQQFFLGLAFSVLVFAGFLVGLRWGVLGVAVSYLVVNYLGAWPYNALAFRVIGLRTVEVLKALRGIALAFAELVAALYLFTVALERWVTAHPAALIVAGALFGTGVYALVLWLVEPELVRNLLRLPAELRRGRTKPHTPPPPPPEDPTPSLPELP